MTAAFDDVDAVVHAAEGSMAAGDYRRAESVLGAALGAHPNQPRLLTLYARVKLAQSDYAAAANSAHAALSVAPDNEYAMRVYSHALELQGRIPKPSRWRGERRPRIRRVISRTTPTRDCCRMRAAPARPCPPSTRRCG